MYLKEARLGATFTACDNWFRVNWIVFCV